MASTSETGHAKNVANLETLISYCTGHGTTYNPTNPEITLPALTTLLNNSKVALKLVKTTETPFNEVEGQRQLTFKPLKPLATKVLSALKSSAVSSTVLTDAQTINRKIQGRRADNPTTENPKTTETTKTPETTNALTPKDKISVSQQSYDMQIDHFDRLIELTLIQPKYKPNETPLQTATLTNYKTELQAINSAVKNAFTPYANAIIARNKILYNPQTGLINTVQSVKNYIKSIFGASSPEYKLINGLSFRINK